MSFFKKTAWLLLPFLAAYGPPLSANALKDTYVNARKLLMEETVIDLRSTYLTEAALEISPKVWNLSLAKCTKLTLQNNADVKISYITTDSTHRIVNQALSEFYPTSTAGFSMGRSRTPDVNGEILASATEAVSYDIGFEQKLPTGGTVSVDLDMSRSGRSRHAHTSDLTFSVSQPLLDGFGGVSLASIRIARNNLEVAIEDLKSQIIVQITNVHLAYWEILNAQEALGVRKLALKQAQDLVKQSKREKQLGNRSATDVLEAEATAASRDVDVIEAENSLEAREDNLKELLNVTDVALWHAKIAVSEKIDPNFYPIIPNGPKSVETAFDNRPDYQNILTNLKNDMISIDVARNGLLPDLSLTALYNMNGAGSSNRSNLENLLEAQHHDWSAGVTVTLPWFDTDDRESYQREKNDLKIRELRIRNLQLQIIKEVRNAVRNVKTAVKKVKTAELSYQLQKKKVAAVQKKYSLGAASSFEVLSFQDDLASESVQRIRSIVDYHQSIIRLWQTLGTTLNENGITFDEESETV